MSLSLQTNSISTDDHLNKFLETSQDLLSLVQHENAILLKDGELSFEAYIARKMDLMQGFEKEAQNLLNKLSAERTGSASIQHLLVEEVKRVRDALHVNSVHQINMLRKRASQNDTNESNVKAEKESTWRH